MGGPCQARLKVSKPKPKLYPTLERVGLSMPNYRVESEFSPSNLKLPTPNHIPRTKWWPLLESICIGTLFLSWEMHRDILVEINKYKPHVLCNKQLMRCLLLCMFDDITIQDGNKINIWLLLYMLCTNLKMISFFINGI